MRLSVREILQCLQDRLPVLLQQSIPFTSGNLFTRLLGGLVCLPAGLVSRQNFHVPTPAPDVLSCALVDVESPQTTVPGRAADVQPQFMVPAVVRVVFDSPSNEQSLPHEFLKSRPRDVLEFWRREWVSNRLAEVMDQNWRHARFG